ncbi:MAG TPA: rhamnulokinase family protein [Chloroflexia bacterium]|nr:rhamnulokinase family protein [Chloroflexia bacterium]
MSQAASFLAIDIGASSGRVMLGRWDGQRFELRELHRFPNGSVQVMGHLHWDVLRIWHEVKAGIAKYAAQHDEPPAGIGIDTWAVDFALLDDAGRLLGNPYHYRDRRTEGMPEEVDRRVSPQQLFAQTGIQRLPINTLYQLASMGQGRDRQLDMAETLLLIPDLFHYWMTGQTVAEYTNATTTQFYDMREQQWATDLLEVLDLPTRILPPVVAPGTILGELLPEVRDEVGLSYPVEVIASASHDTASAVAAIPGLDERSLYISSGTWSLVGVEIAQPILSNRARELNFTNEGGVGGTIRFLKNIGGLWLLQECRRQWQREGQTYTWPALVALAQQATPLRSVVDPDSGEFLNPNDMRAAIQAYCGRTGQPEPTSIGEIVRCCLESLALKYRWVLAALEEMTGPRIDTIRIVGGGSQNGLLCQLTADACGREVVAGPVEATALGNVLVQAVASGHLPDIAAGRRTVAASVQQATFEPRASGDWDAAYRNFDALMQAADDQ